MRAAYICWRPYQLFNSINMVLNDVEKTKGNSDLYIQDIPPLLETLPNLKKAGLFNNIFVFSEINKAGRNDLSKMELFNIYSIRTINFLFPKMALKKNCKEIVNFNNYYDKILASGWISFSIEMVNCNKNAKFILFEDGTANYRIDVLKNFSKNKQSYFRILNKFFKKGPYNVCIDKMYIYEPSLSIVKRDFEVLSLPKINDETYKILCDIFNYNSDEDIYFTDSIVYLDQPMNNDKNLYDDSKVIGCLEKFEHFVIRRHPIQKPTNNSFEDIKRPMWELVSKKLTSNSILISPYSTAQTTPRILYGANPTLIFTYRMLSAEGTDFTNNTTAKTIKLFGESYNGEIYEPSTMKEYVDLINDLKSRRKAS